MNLRKISKPSKVGVPLTEKCHLKCGFCLNNEQLFREGKNLEFNKFKEIIDWLISEGIRKVDLTPIVGEPLAIPNLEYYLEYLEQKSEIEEYELFTSLAFHKLDPVFNRKKLKLVVSLYGYNEKQFLEITKVDGFHLLKSNLKKLILNKLPRKILVLQRCKVPEDFDNELRMYLKISTVFQLMENYSSSRINKFAVDGGKVLPCKFMHEPVVNDTGLSLCCMDVDNKRKVGKIGDKLDEIYGDLLNIVESENLNCNNTCGWFELLDE